MVPPSLAPPPVVVRDHYSLDGQPTTCGGQRSKRDEAHEANAQFERDVVKEVERATVNDADEQLEGDTYAGGRRSTRIAAKYFTMNM